MQRSRARRTLPSLSAVLRSGPVRRTAAAAAALSVLGAAAAEAACYSRAEFEAEQAIRLQSELTVIAFGCPSPAGAASLQVQYGEFARRHGEDMRRHQRAIIDYLRRHERGRPEALFDRFQSSLANEYGFRAGKMTPPTFCAQRLPYFQQVVGFDRDSLRRYLRDDAGVRLATRPLCQPQQVDLPEPETVAASLRTTSVP